MVVAQELGMIHQDLNMTDRQGGRQRHLGKGGGTQILQFIGGECPDFTNLPRVASKFLQILIVKNNSIAQVRS